MMKPVWIVDDDKSIRWVLEKALARAAIPAHSFASAAEALEAFHGANPSVLLTDDRMPGQDGLSLLPRIKQGDPDRKSVVESKRVSVRVSPGGRRVIKKKTQ